MIPYLTPYESWQIEKYGNIIPETKINEDDTSDTDDKDFETVCDCERPAFPYDQVGRNNEGLPSLPDFL